MSAGDETPVLILTGQALKTRRSVDPTAWIVLEELTIRSEAAPRPTVSAEVRSLADALGRSRDAIGRALHALIEAGLVERHASRNELTGQFGTATYRIDLDAAGLQRPTEPRALPSAPPPRRTAPVPPQATSSPHPQRLFEP